MASKQNKEIKRILFFHQGRISDWAGAVFDGLRKEFPAAQILRFDLHTLIKQQPVLLAKSSAAMFFQYWRAILFRKIALDDAFFTTPYLFDQVRRLSLHIHLTNPADFSFQMHSMHDHSGPGIPHFVYTDFTYENCRDYSGYGKTLWAPLRPQWLLNLEQTIYARATGIFTQSQQVQSTIVGKYNIPTEKVLNVRYGPNLNHDLLKNVPMTEARYSSKQIIFVGGDWERKGGPELLAAFKKVLEIHQDAKLIVIGCRPKILNPCVKVIGKLSFGKLLEYYAKASVFCMPSKLEPSASVYVEAMFAGLPVIALNTGSVRELIKHGENGFLVNPGDREQMVQVLLHALGNPGQTLQMGLNARAAVDRDYNWVSVFRHVGAYVRKHISSVR